MSTVAANIATIRAHIAATGTRVGLAHDVRLIAVSKKQPVDAIRSALAAGHRLFGENYVQEAVEKFVPLKQEFPDIELHLLGSLQTNKAEEAVALFDVIETLDRPKLAEAMAKAIAKLGRSPSFYIEVNSGNEPQKGGINPVEAKEFLTLCRDAYHLNVTGLMCIPPAEQEPTPFFYELAELARQLNLPHISMGMSTDYREAIICGATEVRVGTAVFGARQY